MLTFKSMVSKLYIPLSKGKKHAVTTCGNKLWRIIPRRIIYNISGNWKDPVADANCLIQLSTTAISIK